jgi:hypothetical protein
MALGTKHIPEFDAVLGPAQRQRGYQFQPGASDYPTLGYVITAASLGYQFIFGAWVVGMNAAGDAYLAQIVFPAGSFGAPPKPATSFNFVVEIPLFSGTGSFVEVANATDLSSVTWFVAVLGY